MTAEQEQLKMHFLEPETRDGHFIDGKMKAVWKCQLDMLERFAEICQKHDLHYCLIAGTLLGAMRHRGYIPWDDDVDVAMPRSDYDKLLRVAQAELPPPYHFMNRYTDPECGRDYSQIRNSDTAGISPYWVNLKARFNYGIMIDIFPLDGVCGSRLCNKVRSLLLRISNFVLNRSLSRFPVSGMVQKAKTSVAKTLYALLGNRFFVNMRELAFRVVAIQKEGHCGMISFFGTKFKWSSSLFCETKEVPFEYLNLHAPVQFDEVLSVQYGDWRKPVRGGAAHSDMYWDPYRSYKEVLVEKFGFEPFW